MKQRASIIGTGGLLVLASLLGAQQGFTAAAGGADAHAFQWPPPQWPPPGPSPGESVPPPPTFRIGISSSVQDNEAIVRYGLSQPDEAPLWLPDDFHRTADSVRLGWSAHAREVLAAELAKPTPRLPDGHPDLNGGWKGCGIGPGGGGCRVADDFNGGRFSPVLKGEPTADQKAWAVGYATFLRPKNQPVYKSSVDQTTQRELWYHNIYKDPAYQCTPVGVPRLAAPAYVQQTPRQIAFLYTSIADSNPWRAIALGGNIQVNGPATPYGRSVAHWEGDSLVVEVRDLDPSTWFAEFGAIHSANMQVTERYRRVGDILIYQAEVQDPLLAQPYFSTPRYNVVNSLPSEGLPCIQPDNTIRTELYPVPYLPEGNLWN